MNNFKSVPLTQQMLDPTKRVNYTTGLVLGVDEFEQEQLYFIERDRLHSRSLHGYGTVCGLHVSQGGTPDDPEIRVAPGVAVNPQGQSIRVPLAQCALLNAWLAHNTDKVAEHLGSPPASHLALYVTLHYRECETDFVPIPGEPCRTQKDSMAASRIADDFGLSLEFTPPDQVEEDVVRLFGDLLDRIRVTDEPGTLNKEQMAQLVRDLAPLISSPPEEASPPEGEIGSPPDDESILLHPDQAEDILNHAFQVWVTEVRPALLACGRNCASGPPDESRVLLARLDFDIATGADGNFRVAGEVTINTHRRPYLLHTRLLQEWLDDRLHYLLADGAQPLTGDLSAGGNKITDLAEATADGDAVPFQQAIKVDDRAGGDLRGRYPNPNVRRLQGRNVASTQPEDGHALTWSQSARRWESRRFVQAPAGPYAIVAAGFFEADGSPIGIVYGDGFNVTPLRVPGDYVLTFAEYDVNRIKSGEVMYIVKGTVGQGEEQATFQFLKFVDEGLLTRVIDTGNRPIARGFMVEISRIESV